MADKQVVLAIFPDEAAADAAVESLKEWDKNNNLEIGLTSIGVLVLDENGKVKTHKLGSRSAAKGAGIGLVLAVIAPPTLLAGIIGGGILGHFHHKGLGMDAADRDRIASELEGRQGRRWRSRQQRRCRRDRRPVDDAGRRGRSTYRDGRERGRGRRCCAIQSSAAEAAARTETPISVLIHQHRDLRLVEAFAARAVGPRGD